MKRLNILLLAATLFMAMSCTDQDLSKLDQLYKDLDALQQSVDEIKVPGAQEVVVPEDSSFGFTFDKAGYGVDAGGTVRVGYTISDAATVEVVAKDGWSATVNASSDTEGEIVVTAPDPASPYDIVVTATAQDGRFVSALLPVIVRDPYTDATRTDVAAMAYNAFYRDIATDYHFQMMAECGMNMLTIEQVDNWQEQLDLAHKYGMKGVLFVNGAAGDYYRDPSSTKLTEIIDVAKNHPALAGYQIYDEPHLNAMNQMRIEKNRIEELDPNPAHPVYVNLHPSSASVHSLGVEDYHEYVETLITGLNLKFITFDQYPVFTYGLDPSWPRSLDAVYKLSKKYGLRFWAFTLCCREESRVDPNVENIRLQCNLNLAYGAQVNQFFVYRSTSGTALAPLQTWVWKDGIVEGEKEGKVFYTPMYDYCKTYCHEMHNRGYVFADCNVKQLRNVRFFDTYVQAFSTQDLPAQFADMKIEGEAMVSFIENKGNEYIVVVNGSWQNHCSIEAEFNNLVYSVDHDGVFTEHQGGSRASFDLEGGDMMVFKYR